MAMAFDAERGTGHLQVGTLAALAERDRCVAQNPDANVWGMLPTREEVLRRVVG